MDKLDKMLKSVLAGFTTFYGISGSANTLSAGEPESDEINSDFLNVTRIDNKIKTPEYVLELPDRTESGLFASHRSHRSHSSHRSHYSSRTGGSSGSGSGVAIVAVAVGAAYYLGRKNKK